MHCKTCHYSLANRGGLTEHRCPECGREFDPDVRSTFDVATQSRWLGNTAIAIGVSLIVAIAAVLILAFLAIAVRTYRH